jgi:hypothetical protein
LNALRKWILALVIALAFFYGMDQILMSAQGLPLDWSLSPKN